MAQKEGIEAVVRAMKLHEGVAAVQESGCCALSNIAVNNDGNFTKTEKKDRYGNYVCYQHVFIFR